MDLLDELTRLADETPALHDPNQRFGNKAFKTFISKATGYLLDDPLDDTATTGDERQAKTSTFLTTCPEHVRKDVLELWIGGNAWGHETRLDYGTGHELAFVLGLWVLVKRGWIAAGSDVELDKGEDEEDDLVLRVFPR